MPKKRRDEQRRKNRSGPPVSLLLPRASRVRSVRVPRVSGMGPARRAVHNKRSQLRQQACYVLDTDFAEAEYSRKGDMTNGTLEARSPFYRNESRGAGSSHLAGEACPVSRSVQPIYPLDPCRSILIFGVLLLGFRRLHALFRRENDATLLRVGHLQAGCCRG